MTAADGVRVRAAAAWLPEGLAHDVWIDAEDDGVIREVRPGRAADGPVLPGLVVPGLVNAHAHLELSRLAGAVPGGQGFAAWATGLMGQPPPEGDERAGAGRRAAATARDLGTAWLVDVSNGGDTGPWMASAGLRGAVHHELLGFDRGAVAGLVARAAACVRNDAEVPVRPVPHAVFSTAPAVIVACVRAATSVATMHVAESPDEAAFLRVGEGPFAALLDRLGRDWRWWTPPGVSAVAYLDALGVLGPGLALVHGVHLDGDDLARVASRGGGLVTCPRSNLHIGGRLPDLPAWLRHGVRFAVGTDSLASTPDLDVLGEVAALASAYPEVPMAAWLAACTHVGADVVGAPVGRIVPGASPRLLWLDAGAPEDLRRGPPARRWLD